MKDNTRIVASAILGVSLIIAIFIFSGAYKDSRKTGQQINVTGSAKLAIKSDLGILGISIGSYGPTQASAYKALEMQKPALLQYLASQGFTKEMVEFQTVSNFPNFVLNEQGYSTGVIQSYSYSQRLVIQSSDVKKIQELSLTLPTLVEQGIPVQIEPPQYLYTKLSDVKVQVQAEAAKDAMMRAKKIAEATGSTLGSIREARMGVLQITPKNSTEISDYGMNDVSAIEKDITAVVNASFDLE